MEIKSFDKISPLIKILRNLLNFDSKKYCDEKH